MMNFPKADSFALPIVKAKIMGPNPLKLCEELLDGNAPSRISIDPLQAPAQNNMAAPTSGRSKSQSPSQTLAQNACTPKADANSCKSSRPQTLFRNACPSKGAIVCDLGSGTGITSVMLAREYGFNVYAVDLWSDPEENRAFFREMGLSDEVVHPVKADASQGLPFSHGFFDAIVSVDSYNYYGRDPHYLGEKLLPYVKPGGTLHLAIPGMLHDCHDCPPACLLTSWTPKQLEYMHDLAWWRSMIEQTSGVIIEDMHLMECTKEAWTDWIACDNPYATGDRVAVEAGALEHLATIAARLRKE